MPFFRKLIASKFFYLIALTAIFLGAAIVRFHLPQTPWADPDIRGYLLPALSKLTGGAFLHIEGRSFAYPGFLYLILKLFSDFLAISVIQHLLGLGAGALLLASWNRSRFLIKNPHISIHTHRLFGLLITAFFLFSTSVIILEHKIRPEGICAFFAILSILWTIQFLRFQYRSPDVKRAFAYGALNIFTAVFLALLKPSFCLAMLISTVPIWIAIFSRRAAIGALPFYKRLPVLIVPLILAFVLLILPENRLKKTDLASRTFLPTTLFTIHANIILKQIQSDIANHEKTPYSEKFLQKTEQLLSRDIQKSKKTGDYKSLGFDPDYLMYRSFNEQFRTWFPIQTADMDEVHFYDYYYFRSLKNQPFAFVKKWLGQLALAYVGKPGFYSSPRTFSADSLFVKNGRVFKHKQDILKVNYEPLNTFLKKSKSLERTDSGINQTAILSFFDSLLEIFYTPSIFLLLVLIALIVKNPRDSHFKKNLLLFSLTVLLLFGYSFGNCLGIAIVHSLEVKRYLTIQFIVCLLPECMALYLLAECFCARRNVAAVPPSEITPEVVC